MVRSPTYDENGMKKGAWSKEEDEKLIAYIQKYGHWNWRQLPKFAGLSRCGKSCRLRWMNYLRPNLKHGNYTKEEEDMIIKLHEELGNKWSAIATKMPGRTDNEIKNHWHSHLKKLKTSKDNYSSESDYRNQIEVKEFESVSLSNNFSNPILESSSLSPETPSNEFCSPDSVFNLNYVTEEGNTLASWETIEDCIGDFWTQPFMTDRDYNQDCISSTFVQDGFQLPYDSYYGDNDVEFFYQVLMQQ